MDTKLLEINQPMPDFTALPGVDGKNHTASEYRGNKVLVVVFSCNHCPYVKAYEDRMIAFQKQYGSRGVQLLAINANDQTN